MSHIEGSITIGAPPAKVLEALEDIPRAPEWVPSLQKVWDIEGHGQGCKYKWTFKMGGIPIEGATKITEVTRERLVMTTTSGLPSTWTWELKPAGGGTELKLSIEYTLPGSVFGALADRGMIEAQNQKELHAALANLKVRLEGDGAAARARAET